MSVSPQNSLDLREFVKDFQEKVATFCFYFLPSESPTEDLLVSIFRRFGEKYRTQIDKNDGKREPIEMKIQLFQIAWDKIQDSALVDSMNWPVGRDIRRLKAMDENVLADCQATDVTGNLNLDENAVNEVTFRLRRVDAENRAAVILKDILGFEDEEVMRMLSLRWGVFRHRLHRGRLDFCEVLKGAAVKSKPTKQDSSHVSW